MGEHLTEHAWRNALPERRGESDLHAELSLARAALPNKLHMVLLAHAPSQQDLIDAAAAGDLVRARGMASGPISQQKALCSSTNAMEGISRANLDHHWLGLKSGETPSAACRQEPCPLELLQQLSARLNFGCNALLNMFSEGSYSLFQQQHHHDIPASHDCKSYCLKFRCEAISWPHSAPPVSLPVLCGGMAQLCLSESSRLQGEAGLSVTNFRITQNCTWIITAQYRQHLLETWLPGHGAVVHLLGGECQGRIA